MSYIFKKRNIYYLCVKHKGNRIRKSLGTSNKAIAISLADQLEASFLQELIIGKSQTKYTNSNISELIQLFMSYEHNWRPRTREVYETCFKHYLDKGLPETQTYKAMVIRCLNRLQNWAFQEGFIDKPRLIPGGNNYVCRNRVFNKIELNMREIGFGDVMVNKNMKFLVKTFYSILLNCEKYNKMNFKDKNKFFHKYLKSNANNTIINKGVIDYFDKYEAFCFDLSPDSVLSGELNFNYK